MPSSKPVLPAQPAFGVEFSRAALLAGSLLVVLACIGEAWWLRSPLHAMPLERDEGAYATIATNWFAGKALYRDLFDHKPPLVYVVYALARLVPADPVVAVRIIATVYLVATGLALATLAARLYGGVAALSALALWLAYGSSLRFQGLTFNTELVMALPAVLGCSCVVAGVRSHRLRFVAFAGVGVGLSIAAKPVGVMLVVPLLLASVLIFATWQEQWRGMLMACLGVALPLVGFALMLLAQGALPAAYEALVLYNQLYAAESAAFGWDPTWLWRIWQPMLLLFVPALLGFGAAWLAGYRSREYLLVGVWGLALLLTALLSLRAYPHYYLVAVPFACLWVGAGIALIERIVRWRWMSAVVQFVVLVALVWPPIAEVRAFTNRPPEEYAGNLYGLDGWLYFNYARAAAEYVDQHVPPGEPIFVWAAEPQIYYLANRPPVSRFVYDYPVERLPGGRDQLLRELNAAPPRLIITYHDVRPMGFDPFMPEHAYKLRATIGGFDVYERE